MQYDTMTDAVRYGPKPKYSESLNAGIVTFRNEYRIADEYLHALAEKSGGRLYRVASGPRLHQADNPPGPGAGVYADERGTAAAIQSRVLPEASRQS